MPYFLEFLQSVQSHYSEHIRRHDIDYSRVLIAVAVVLLLNYKVVICGQYTNLNKIAKFNISP